MSCVAPTAIATSADPFDPYAPEAGRGELARFAAGQAPRGRVPAPGGGRMIEGFADGAAPVSGVRMGDRDRVTYKGMAADYNYYKEYGVDLPKVEGFAGPIPRSQQQQQCRSPPPQIYEIPLTPEAKAAYDRAMQAALDAGDDTGATAPMKPMRREVDMSSVQGYYDPDLENYLATADLKAGTGGAAVLTSPAVARAGVGAAAAVPYDPKESPFSEALTKFKGQMRPPLADAEVPRRRRGADDTWQSVWEIMLFVIAGILVIFLCEQLFKLAVVVGMQRTINILEPYLAATAATAAASKKA